VKIIRYDSSLARSDQQRWDIRQPGAFLQSPSLAPLRTCFKAWPCSYDKLRKALKSRHAERSEASLYF